MKKTASANPAIRISVFNFYQNPILKISLFILSFSLIFLNGFGETPVNGITDFNTYTGWTDLTGTQKAGSAGLTASNVKGYDFTVYSLNDNPDCGIGIEPFTGQTPMVYGFSYTGLSHINSLKVSSNGLRYFDLNAVDVSIDNDARTSRLVTITGYRDGSPVSGAILAMTLGAASSNVLLTTYNVTANSAFKNIDAFIISVPGTDVGAIGVDNINAVNFRNGALPLNLVSFTGHTVTDGVSLNWTTTNEVNTRSFEVQKGLNNAFSTIATIPASDQAINEHAYNFIDHPAVTTNLFYRLKITDRDGHFSYSPVISIMYCTNDKGYTLYPNPVTGNVLYIKLASENIGSLSVSIASIAGYIVDVQNIQAPGLGIRQIPLNISKLPAGIYHLRITEIKTGKLTVLPFVR